MTTYTSFQDDHFESHLSFESTDGSTKPLVQPFEVETSGQQRKVRRGRSRGRVSKDFSGELDKEIRRFQGYRAPLWKQVLFWVIGVLTGGVSLLVTKWKKDVYLLLGFSACSLRVAEYVLVELLDGTKDLVKVKVIVLPRIFGDSQPALNGLSEHRDNLLDEQLSSFASQLRLLEYRCGRYFYVDSIDTFVPVPDIPKGYNEQLQKMAMEIGSVSNITQVDEGDWEPEERQFRYGHNEMRIHVRSILNIVWEEMWHPFYVFQYFSIAVWVFGDQYYSYSVCIALITWFSILTSAVETHNNMKRLADLAYYACEVEVLRDGEFRRISSTELVPGDLVVVEPAVLSCDVVLLKGEAILDENMLTGESVPVRKVSYSPVADGLNYHPDKNSNCTMYAGTLVAQARAPRNQKVIGMVCRTSFFSAKGALLRSILFPKEVQEHFIGDALWFIFMMGVGCIALYIWAATALVAAGTDWQRIVIRLFDMITVAVPPALPACLTICTVFAIGRLRKKDIYVTNPERITMAGHLDVIAFDKTGTLTQQGLDLKGIVPIMNGIVGELTTVMADLPLLIVELSASCHGLARMGEQLVGDPLDQKLFAATHWALLDDGHGAEEEEEEQATSAIVQQHKKHQIHTYVHPPGQPGTRYAVLRRFEFSSQAQRNGVVVKAPDGRTLFFSKGSPEMIRTLVEPTSIPANFDQVLESFTREGYRVLAMAQADAGSLDEAALYGMTQDEVESGLQLQLVGFAVMDNPLRSDTSEVIHKLQMADLRCCMVTGDHVRTAISVAHQCGIMRVQRPICLVDALSSHLPGESPLRLSVLQPLGPEQENVSRSSVLQQISGGDIECAVTGKGFSKLLELADKELFRVVLRRCCVFARMSPDNKKDLMLLLGNGLDGHDEAPHLGLFVGFCGDGANDCGALKAAHVGVSLCEAEASVAAPMTSKEQTINAMVKVVAEGRCTLMATFQIFQFIIGYAMVQAFSTNLMYMVILDLGNYQYLIQDLFFTTVLAALMGYTEPRAVLSREKPLQRVMSWPLMTSTAMQLVFVIVFQSAALEHLKQQPGYSFDYSHRDFKLLKDVRAPENTTIYLMGLSQFIILALVFNKGAPHRSPMFTNWQLTLALCVQIAFIFFTFFSNNKFNRNVQELMDFSKPTTLRFRWELVGLVVANAVAAVVAEYVITPLAMRAINAIRAAIRPTTPKNE